MKIGRHQIELSNEDKVLFPDSDITKGDLIRYYHKIAGRMVPLIRNRPLTLQRFPDGIGGSGFFQKDRSDYFPKWIKSVKIPKKGGSVEHVLCNNAATLVYLANQAVITPHIWLCRKDKIRKPDRLIFDLDPPADNFGIVLEGARAIRKVLQDELELTPYLMTTGSSGLHVVVPILRIYDFDRVRDFSRSLAEYVSAQDPGKFTTEVRKNKRNNRLFIDYLRNAYAQTGVAPYSVRPYEGAPVATPIRWEDLDDKYLDPRLYNISNIFNRLKNREDPWKSMKKTQQGIGKAVKKLKTL